MSVLSHMTSAVLSAKTQYRISHSEEPMLDIVELENNYEAETESITLYGKDGNIMYEAVNKEEHPDWVVSVLQNI